MSGLFDFSAPNVWDALAQSNDPIVLYGMGNGADKVLDEMARRGISPAGVMASEGFVRHQDFRGFTVSSEEELTQKLGDFTVALCFGSDLPDVMDAIRAVARRHTLLIPNVPVIGETIMDDDFIREHTEEIEAAYRLLSDARSQMTFKGALDFFYTGRLPYLERIESPKDEVFTDILRLSDESYLDLGAYRGDTVAEFLHYTNGYRAITAVEPNPKNYEKLCAYCADIPHCTPINAGIADSEGRMQVSKGGGRMASLTAGSGIAVPVTTVDALDYAPSYIKVDIEGMERAMLRGAPNTLKTRPKLNIAAYHRTEDFFSLLLQIHEINPEYRLFLRKHPYIPCWDLNIYAI